MPGVRFLQVKSPACPTLKNLWDGEPKANVTKFEDFQKFSVQMRVLKTSLLPLSSLLHPVSLLPLLPAHRQQRSR